MYRRIRLAFRNREFIQTNLNEYLIDPAITQHFANDNTFKGDNIEFLELKKYRSLLTLFGIYIAIFLSVIITANLILLPYSESLIKFHNNSGMKMILLMILFAIWGLIETIMFIYVVIKIPINLIKFFFEVMQGIVTDSRGLPSTVTKSFTVKQSTPHTFPDASDTPLAYGTVIKVDACPIPICKIVDLCNTSGVLVEWFCGTNSNPTAGGLITSGIDLKSITIGPGGPSQFTSGYDYLSKRTNGCIYPQLRDPNQLTSCGIVIPVHIEPRRS